MAESPSAVILEPRKEMGTLKTLLTHWNPPFPWIFWDNFPYCLCHWVFPNWKHLLLGRKVMTNLDSILKSRHYFVNKYLSSQGYGFSRGHVWMWEIDCKESWALKNWCFWTVVLEKTLQSSLDCKEIQPVHPKGDQSWCSLKGLMLKP